MAHLHRVAPFAHQTDYLERHAELEGWCLFWEQGTAKTKPMIDQACEQYREGKIDAMLVVASNGVHANWVTDELKAHLQEDMVHRTRAMIWYSSRARLVQTQADMKSILAHDGLSILTMTYDGFMTEAGKKLAWRFLQKRRVLFVIDEAHNIKSPNARRTKSVLAAGKYAPYRRALTGTPVAVGPFDVYAPVKFVDPSFWERHGFGSYAAYKAHFGIWEKRWTRAGGEEREYDSLEGYRNLEELHDLLDLISTRWTKDEVLDLPPKLYSKRRFDITPTQRRHYDELTREYITFLESGGMVDAPLAITRMIRWQQITSGYLPGEDGQLQRLGDKNPRLEQMEIIRDGTANPTIVWARFTDDVDQIMDLLGPTAVRYDGRCSDEQKERAKEAFQHGDAPWFVGNPMCCREGLTLHRAKTCVYYSNSMRLLDRLQSEDRAHRAGMDEHPVDYIDLVANDTVDEAIIDNLRGKVEIASVITGDKLREWL